MCKGFAASSDYFSASPRPPTRNRPAQEPARSADGTPVSRAPAELRPHLACKTPGRLVQTMHGASGRRYYTARGPVDKNAHVRIFYSPMARHLTLIRCYFYRHFTYLQRRILASGKKVVRIFDCSTHTENMRPAEWQEGTRFSKTVVVINSKTYIFFCLLEKSRKYGTNFVSY
jgi:hypothetical protein